MALLRQSPAGGWVYILINTSFRHLVKVGCTGRTPEERAAELTASSGVPTPFVVAWAAPVSDYKRCEKLVHVRLGHLRETNKREFFRCDVATARRAIEDAARDLLRPWWWRLLFLRRPAAKRPPWQRGRRGSDGLLVGGLLLAVAGGVVLFKPAPARWMPPPVAHVLALLEGRQ